MKGWICNACLRKDPCICSGSDDTTVVDLVAWEDEEPTRVFPRPRRETLNGYQAGREPADVVTAYRAVNGGGR